ncbi:uncharacterized protein VTP21DRAFT_3592 [Calcarisporiella thermophila]|uniref:uncharacterized protein n=1 Tax=Calcarisporiella thermophila TaxID=911321 RepID=UPI0037446321
MALRKHSSTPQRTRTRPMHHQGTTVPSSDTPHRMQHEEGSMESPSEKSHAKQREEKPMESTTEKSHAMKDDEKTMESTGDKPSLMQHDEKQKDSSADKPSASSKESSSIMKDHSMSNTDSTTPAPEHTVERTVQVTHTLTQTTTATETVTITQMTRITETSAPTPPTNIKPVKSPGSDAPIANQEMDSASGKSTKARPTSTWKTSGFTPSMMPYPPATRVMPGAMTMGEMMMSDASMATNTPMTNLGTTQHKMSPMGEAMTPQRFAQQQSQPNNEVVIIGSTVFSALAVASIVGFLVYRRRRRSRSVAPNESKAPPAEISSPILFETSAATGTSVETAEYTRQFVSEEEYSSTPPDARRSSILDPMPPRNASSNGSYNSNLILPSSTHSSVGHASLNAYYNAVMDSMNQMDRSLPQARRDGGSSVGTEQSRVEHYLQVNGGVPLRFSARSGSTGMGSGVSVILDVEGEERLRDRTVLPLPPRRRL